MKTKNWNNENCLQNDTLGLSDTRRPKKSGQMGATPRTPTSKFKSSLEADKNEKETP